MIVYKKTLSTRKQNLISFSYLSRKWKLRVHSHVTLDHTRNKLSTGCLNLKKESTLTRQLKLYILAGRLTESVTSMCLKI